MQKFKEWLKINHPETIDEGWGKNLTAMALMGLGGALGGAGYNAYKSHQAPRVPTGSPAITAPAPAPKFDKTLQDKKITIDDEDNVDSSPTGNDEPGTNVIKGPLRGGDPDLNKKLDRAAKWKQRMGTRSTPGKINNSSTSIPD